MIAPSPAVFAQLLVAVIALAYGSAFVGLWLHYRRDAMRAFAFAWLALGVYSLVTVFWLEVYRGAMPARDAVLTGLTAATAVLSVIASAWMISATSAVITPDRAPRWLRPVALAVAVFLLVMVLLDRPLAISTIRLVFVAAWGWGLIAAVRAAPSPGRRSLAAFHALMLLRVFLALALISLTTGDQPLWYTILQMIVTIAAGFLSTTAAFSLEREAALRERVTYERGAAQSQRMESMGRMASSVAHDFNNILTSVLAASESVSDDLAAPAERAEARADVGAAVQRGKELTQQLLAFARPAASQSVEFDPARRVLDLVPMIERLVGRERPVACSVAEALRASPCAVLADAVQFDQVMLNLAANARDAMPHGGTLAIDCALSTSERELGAAGLSAGRYVRVRMTDSGSGMTPETIARIFDPYFTTKAPGKGTGLGLATAFAFVRQAQGAIRVQSADGAGSTFWIYLPVKIPGRARADLA